MIPTATIDTLEQCWRSLAELTRDLDEQLWKTATDLPGWTVQDNLAHLIGTERMLQGLAATSHRSATRDYVNNSIGEMNEHEVDSRRALPGATVRDEWNDLTALRLTTLRAGNSGYFEQPMMTPTGPGTLADFLHVRVLDCWLHEQDMRRATGRPGNLAGPAAELTIDRLIRTVPIVVGKRAATPEGAAVVIQLTGPVHRQIVCEVRDGRAALLEAPTAPPISTIWLDSEAFVMLAAGRRQFDAIASTIDGDEQHGARVLSQFNMMI